MKKITLLIAIVFASLNFFGQDGWTKVPSKLTAGKGIGQISIGMNDSTALWALAINADGSIFDSFTRSVDGGITWEKGTFNAGTGLSQLFAFDADVCWAVFNTGASQGLYKTEDGGLTWVKKGGVYGSASFANLLHFFDNMNGFAQGDPVDGYFEIYTTTDGGETWTRVPQGDIPAPVSGEYGITGNYCSYGNNAWFGTNKARIFRSTDMGYTWTAALTTLLDGDGTTPATVASVMFDDMNGFAYTSYLNVGFQDILNKTSDGGVTWEEFFPEGQNYARYLSVVPGTENTVIGTAGAASDNGMGVSISYDGGLSWEVITDNYDFQASAWLSLETGWCGSTSTATGGVYIYGNPPAPTNLDATVSPDDVVTLTWNAPGAGGGVEELIYDDNVATGSYSYNGYTMSTHMSPSGPCKLLSLKYYTSIDAGDNTFNVNLFNWAGSEPGTEIVYTESATAVDGDWMEIDLSAQDIFFTGDFVAGFGSINETTYVGYDENLDNGRSWDFDNAGETWESWTEAYLIRAVVEYSDGSVAVLGGSQNDSKVTANRGISKSSHPTDYSNVQASNPIHGRSANGLELLGYNVFRNDEMINAELVTTEEYVDADAPIGVYEYYVTAVYTGGESDPSNVATIIVTSLIDNKENILKVYPNPAYDVLNIEAPSIINKVLITNIVGQTVYSNIGQNSNSTINISRLESGVYFVQIETELGISTQKIVVE